MKFRLMFGGKKYEVDITPTSETGYAIELFTKEKISENEFQKLRQYLVDEGYIDIVFNDCL